MPFVIVCLALVTFVILLPVIGYVSYWFEIIGYRFAKTKRIAEE